MSSRQKYNFDCGSVDWIIDPLLSKQSGRFLGPSLKTGAILWSFDWNSWSNDDDWKDVYVFVKGKTERKCDVFRSQMWFDLIHPRRMMNIGVLESKKAVNELTFTYRVRLSHILPREFERVTLRITNELITIGSSTIIDLKRPKTLSLSSTTLCDNVLTTNVENKTELLNPYHKRKISPQNSISEYGGLECEIPSESNLTTGECIRSPMLNTGSITWYFEFSCFLCEQYDVPFVMVRGKTKVSNKHLRIQIQFVSENSDGYHETVGFFDYETASDDLSHTCYLYKNYNPPTDRSHKIWITVRSYEIHNLPSIFPLMIDDKDLEKQPESDSLTSSESISKFLSPNNKVQSTGIKIINSPRGDSENSPTDAIAITDDSENEMNEISLNEISGLKKLSLDLKQLLENEQFCDVVISTKEENFNVHKSIISARSSMLAEMVLSKDIPDDTDHDIEHTENVIFIPDVSGPVMKEVIGYIYSGKLKDDLTSKVYMEIYSVSDKFRLPDLKTKCGRFLMSLLDLSNVCEIALLAHVHKDKALFAVAKSLIDSNVVGVLTSSGWFNLVQKEPVLASEISDIFRSQF